MSQVIQIGIHESRGDKVRAMDKVEAVKGKGLVNNRHFKENNEKKSQITLIEIENINYYNKISKTQIPSINFRQNIVTSSIKLK